MGVLFNLRPACTIPLVSVRPRLTSRPVLRIFAILLVIGLLLSAAPEATPAHAEEDGIHVVQRGESLSAIAQRYQVSLSELARKNGITNPNVIYVGQRLVIPGSPAEAARSGHAASLASTGSGYYTVARGDTLAQIARDHGMSLDDLMRLNGLTNPNFIWVGQRLRVSARVAPTVDEKAAPKPAVATAIHVVQVGETLEEIAQAYGTTVYELMAANGLPNPNFIWSGQRLRVRKSQNSGLLATDPPADGVKWIEVNLTNQTLTAWQGNVPVLHVSVSTGTAATPTVTGRFRIYAKLTSQDMSGPGYYLPNVPWVMYFFQGYGIHGTYWHNNFGTPMSHGCVNMRIPDAEWLFNWAPMGTEVYVHY